MSVWGHGSLSLILYLTGSAFKPCKSPLHHPQDMFVSSYHRKVSLQGTLISLDFSHPSIAHIIYLFTGANSSSGILLIPLADTVIATSNIIIAALVGNEIMVSVTYNLGSCAFSHPQPHTLAVTGSPSRYQRSAW